MTNKIVNKLKLVDDPKCLYCGSEESLTLTLQCENVTNLWRSVELWLRDIKSTCKNIKITEIGKISCINNGDILINTVF